MDSNQTSGFSPAQVEGFKALTELTLDLHWSWNHAADELWRQLDPALWELAPHPFVVLQAVSREQLERVLADPAFRKRVEDQVQAKRRAAETPAWFQQQHAGAPLTCVAYFCMEFMLSEALPIYSGGLGNVAGDQLKAFSDLGVPVVAVGLLYQQGLFPPGYRQEWRAAGSLPAQRPRAIAHHAATHTERGRVASGDCPTGSFALAARLAGPGRPREALPAGQQ